MPGIKVVAAGAVALSMGCGGSSPGTGKASVPAAKASTEVRVPSVLGEAESRAQCALAAAGLRWRYRGDGRVHLRPIISCSGTAAVTPDPKVVSQSPGAGTRLRRRSVVLLDDECLRLVREHQGCA
jgi:hypothetical protein